MLMRSPWVGLGSRHRLASDNLRSDSNGAPSRCASRLSSSPPAGGRCRISAPPGVMLGGGRAAARRRAVRRRRPAALPPGRAACLAGRRALAARTGPRPGVRPSAPPPPPCGCAAAPAARPARSCGRRRIAAHSHATRRADPVEMDRHAADEDVAEEDASRHQQHQRPDVLADFALASPRPERVDASSFLNLLALHLALDQLARLAALGRCRPASCLQQGRRWSRGRETRPSTAR